VGHQVASFGGLVALGERGRTRRTQRPIVPEASAVSESVQAADTAPVSTPPLPSYPPYAAPPPTTQRRRPSKWWFALGAGLVVAAVVIGVTVLVLTVRGFMETDATVRVDGRTHSVTVPTDGDRILWYDRSTTDPTCEVVDLETGEPIRLEDPDASYERDFGDRGDQVGAWTFDPGSGELEVTCSPDLQTVVEIGPSPDFASFFGGIAVGILVPLLLGGTGFVLLIVVGVLYATGRPRSTT
jgi:hypothetical protein